MNIEDKDFLEFVSNKMRDGVDTENLDAAKCIEWIGPVNNCGYGYIYYKRRQHVVHRLSWVLAHGSLDKGIRLIHLCDNRLCVNIDHLGLRAQKDRYRCESKVNINKESEKFYKLQNPTASNVNIDDKVLIYKSALSSLRERVLSIIKQDESKTHLFTANKRMRGFVDGGDMEVRMYFDVLARVNALQ